MTLHKIITSKLSWANLSDITQFMGYNKTQSPKAIKRLEHLVTDEYLGLYSNTFDFKYSNKEFLTKLAQVLGIPVCQDDFDTITSTHDDKPNRIKSYVFIDTEFVRTSQPVFVLAACNHQRYIRLDDDIQMKPLHEQATHVQSIVKQHYYIESSGEIGIWGRVKRYVFHCDYNIKIELTVDGTVLGEVDDISIGKAHIGINNTDITDMVKPRS